MSIVYNVSNHFYYEPFIINVIEDNKISNNGTSKSKFGIVGSITNLESKCESLSSYDILVSFKTAITNSNSSELIFNMIYVKKNKYDTSTIAYLLYDDQYSNETSNATLENLIFTEICKSSEILKSLKIKTVKSINLGSIISSLFKKHNIYYYDYIFKARQSHRNLLNITLTGNFYDSISFNFHSIIDIRAELTKLIESLIKIMQYNSIKSDIIAFINYITGYSILNTGLNQYRIGDVSNANVFIKYANRKMKDIYEDSFTNAEFIKFKDIIDTQIYPTTVKSVSIRILNVRGIRIIISNNVSFHFPASVDRFGPLKLVHFVYAWLKYHKKLLDFYAAVNIVKLEIL